MVRVAERFGVSGSYLARICGQLNVPRPERGYWAKLAVGKAPAVRQLPEAQPGDPVAWIHEGERMETPRLPSAPKPRDVETRPVRLSRSRVHGLAKGLREHFQKVYPGEEGSLLRPYKRLMADVISSQRSLDRAVSLANDLYNAFESVGHRVVIAPAGSSLYRDRIDEREAGGRTRERWERIGTWSPDRPTVAYVGEVAVGLSVIEMTEHVTMRNVDGRYVREEEARGLLLRSRTYSWTTTRDTPSGRFRIVAFAPQARISWSVQWQESGSRSLRGSLREIVAAVEKAAPELADMLREAERVAEAERLERLAQQDRWEREEDHRRKLKAVEDSRTELAEIIQKWADAASVRAFLAGVEERAAGLPEDEVGEIRERLRLAREFLGDLEPLDYFRSWRTPIERHRPRFDD